jgi:selenocysteine lyase/cysteine desulfurase
MINVHKARQETPGCRNVLHFNNAGAALMPQPVIEAVNAHYDYLIQPNAKRFETWETNYSNKIGLAAAIEYALSWGLDHIWQRICHLADRLRKNLEEIPEITLQDLGKRKCGIVTFTVKGVSAQEMCSKLHTKKINVSVSLVDYARLDMEARGLSSLVRASVHYFNTEEEIEKFCAAIKQLLGQRD